jgi:hypothetical protein
MVIIEFGILYRRKNLLGFKSAHFTHLITSMLLITTPTVGIATEISSKASEKFEDDGSRDEALVSEDTPVIFKTSYIGAILNQNYTTHSSNKVLTAPRVSLGAEYRFFYKDEWTLAITGEFKGQSSRRENKNNASFTISQETQKIMRIYHPWYFSTGGRFSYHIPIKKVSIPYDRDQDRNVFTSGAITASTLLGINENTLIMLSAQRWTSLSSQKENGFSTAITTLMTIR